MKGGKNVDSGVARQPKLKQCQRTCLPTWGRGDMFDYVSSQIALRVP